MLGHCSTFPQSDAYLGDEVEADLYINDLRHLNAIYSKLIEDKQSDMQAQIYIMRKAKVQSERIRAWIELRRIKSRCVDLYFYWLSELLRMEVIPEICAATMHLIMIGNCQWFLARYGTIRSRVSAHCSKPEVYFHQAMATYSRIFDLLDGEIPKQNPFYQYLMHRSAELIRDAKASIARQNELRLRDASVSSANNSDTAGSLDIGEMETDVTLTSLSLSESAGACKPITQKNEIISSGLVKNMSASRTKHPPDESAVETLCCPCIRFEKLRSSKSKKKEPDKMPKLKHP